MPLVQYYTRIDELITLMHSCPKASGVERIYIPGERAHEEQTRRESQGIPLSIRSQRELRSLAERLGVKFPKSRPASGSSPSQLFLGGGIVRPRR